MQDETEITISGVKLTDAESMTVLIAIDTLANVLAALRPGGNAYNTRTSWPETCYTWRASGAFVPIARCSGFSPSC